VNLKDIYKVWESDKYKKELKDYILLDPNSNENIKSPTIKIINQDLI
jgi:hypothetical protein